MRKKSVRILAVALVAVAVWNISEWHPQALAGNFPTYVEETEELPDEVLYQEVPYGTKYRDLELPTKLDAYLVFEEEEDEAETATRSQVSVRKASSSQAVVRKASASEAESAQEVSGNGYWKEVRVRWVLDEAFSEAEKYDPELPGVYVFNAELKNSRYDADESSLPRIEVVVLPEDEQVAMFDGDENVTETIDVNIKWVDMDFTYWDGDWDTLTLTYKTGRWKNTHSLANYISVTNNSNIPIQVDYDFLNASEYYSTSDPKLSSWLPQLSGTFTTTADGTGSEIKEQILDAKSGEQDASAPTATVYLSLHSDSRPVKALSDTNGNKIGTVTVSISKAGSTVGGTEDE